CGVERLRGARARAGAVVLLAAWPALAAPRLIFAGSARERALALMYPNPLFETKALGEEIARRASPGDRLQVFGSEGALFVYSGLRPATRRTLCYPLTLFPDGDAGWREEMAELSAAPPRFVVWSGQPLSTMIAARPGLSYRDALKGFVTGRYRLLGSVRVTDSPSLPSFSPAAPGETADLAATDRLWLFERRY
ncbi:MAG: hypothetical protein KGM24_03405, partial [Elusimicrobia bacterium]|nr:hypothetical protein [Elusimicrobiota bacterium]